MLSSDHISQKKKKKLVFSFMIFLMIGSDLPTFINVRNQKNILEED